MADPLSYRPTIIPEEPGVYRFYNEAEKVIYVGKARDLKKRVSSYFNKNSGINLKTRRMVKEIAKIEVQKNSVLITKELEMEIKNMLTEKFGFNREDFESLYPELL